MRRNSRAGGTPSDLPPSGLRAGASKPPSVPSLRLGGVKGAGGAQTSSRGSSSHGSNSSSSSSRVGTAAPSSRAGTPNSAPVSAASAAAAHQQLLHAFTAELQGLPELTYVRLEGEGEAGGKGAKERREGQRLVAGSGEAVGGAVSECWSVAVCFAASAVCVCVCNVSFLEA